MRIEKNTVPFTAASIATTGVPVTLVDFDFQDAEMISILVEITSHAGTATNTFFDLVPRVGSIVTPGVAANGDVIGTADLTNLTGLFGLARIGAPGAAKTAYAGHAFSVEPANNEWRVRVSGSGAGHTVTGNVHIFRRFR